MLITCTLLYNIRGQLYFLIRFSQCDRIWIKAITVLNNSASSNASENRTKYISTLGLEEFVIDLFHLFLVYRNKRLYFLIIWNLFMGTLAINIKSIFIIQSFSNITTSYLKPSNVNGRFNPIHETKYCQCCNMSQK